MNKSLGIVLMIVGAVLLIYGINATDTLGSDVSRTITGTPTDKSMWLLVTGIAAAVGGLYLTAHKSVNSLGE